MVNFKKVTFFMIIVALIFLTIAVTNVNAVNQSKSFKEDFETGEAIGWTVTDGDWQVEKEGDNNYYHKSDGNVFGLSGYDDAVFSDFEVSISAKINSWGDQVPDGNMGILARFTDTSNFYLFDYNDIKGVLRMQKCFLGEYTEMISKEYVLNNEWHTMKASLVGSKLTLYIDNVKELEFDDVEGTMAPGRIALDAYNCDVSFDNIVVNVMGDNETVASVSQVISTSPSPSPTASTAESVSPTASKTPSTSPSASSSKVSSTSPLSVNTTSPAIDNKTSKIDGIILPIIIGAALLAAAGITGVIILKKKKS